MIPLSWNLKSGEVRNSWMYRESLTVASATPYTTQGDGTQRVRVLENVRWPGCHAQDSFHPAPIWPVFSLSRGGGHGSREGTIALPGLFSYSQLTILNCVKYKHCSDNFYNEREREREMSFFQGKHSMWYEC